MLEFAKETLTLLPFLFVTYLVLEAVEAHAGGALSRWLERARSVGPLAGALAGAVPQCGVSAAAASFYAGGVVSVGTLVAVFLSTSDELIPVLLSKQVPAALMVKIVALKVAAAIVVGFSLNALLAFARHIRRHVEVGELCEHSLCGCREHKGILVPALIHTAEIFAFIVVVSGAIELAMHFWGEDSLQGFSGSFPTAPYPSRARSCTARARCPQARSWRPPSLALVSDSSSSSARTGTSWRTSRSSRSCTFRASRSDGSQASSSDQPRKIIETRH